MINFLYKFKKPEYYFHLTNIVKRINSNNQKGTIQCKTIWGATMEVEASDAIGKSILRTGLYDLALSEILWLLAEPNSLSIDIGANIGYTSLLMLHRSKPNGKLLLFEPNPNLALRLELNLEKYLHNGRATIYKCALSNICGKGFLDLPDLNMHNDGIGSVIQKENEHSVPIELKKLDDILKSDTIINLVKIDVEGHEFEVLLGAEQLLNEHSIKHLVFEEHQLYPTKVTDYLELKGYLVFRIQKNWNRISLENPFSPLPEDTAFEAVNYIATIDLDYVKQKIDQSFKYQIL